MIKTTIRGIFLTYLILQSVDIVYAMNNNTNPENTTIGSENTKKILKQTETALTEQLNRLRNVLQSRPHVQNNSSIRVENHILVVDEDDSIKNSGHGDQDKENGSDEEERLDYQEGETYTLSDFDYVRNISREEFVNGCEIGMFSQDFLWIKQIDNPEFKDLQSTGRLQEMVLESAMGLSVLKPVMMSRISCNNEINNNNNNNSNSNQNAYNEEPEQQPGIQTRECLVCADDIPEHEFIKLGCGHDSYCKGCLANFLKLGLEVRDSKLWKCLIKKCTHQMTFPEIAMISKDEKIKITELNTLPDEPQYTREVIKNLVKSGAFAQEKLLLNACKELLECEKLKLSNNTIFCPINYCNAWFKKPLKTEIISCKTCKNEYCSDCLRYHNIKKRTCEQHQQFLNLNEQDQKTLEMVEKISKKCPECTVSIERAKGCLHMTCSQCNHNFCWICLKESSEKVLPTKCSSFKCVTENKTLRDLGDI
jgi:hypothetical protein